MPDTVTYTAEGSDLVTEIIPDAETGEYAFLMPPANVTVKAVFKKLPGRITSASLLLQNNITVNLYALFTEEPDNLAMTVTMNNETTELTGEPVSGETGKYRFAFEGLDPQNIADTFTAEMTYEVNGQAYTDTLEDYSVQKYCENTLDLSDAELTPLLAENATLAELRTLLVDVLYYGAAAQAYMDYNTGNPATQNLTDDEMAYARIFAAPDAAKGVITDLLEGTANDQYAWKTVQVILTNAANIRLIFKAAGTENLAVEVNGTTYEGSDIVQRSSTTWYVDLHGISAGSFRDALTAKLLKNGEEIGQTLHYSMNTYVSRMYDQFDDTTNEMIQRLYNSGESAYAYAN